jgi:hypothetical protein|tara:strand:- start:5410 stop:5943 length:534 start_codon:yes stop_codon:yes gene_type:complete
MSLIALKRKTSATYKTASTNQVAFSLNGTRRNKSYIGQTIIKPKEFLCLNDDDVVKKSSINTKAMIRGKYKYIWRPLPYSSFNPRGNSNNINSIQSEYITRLAKQALASSILTTEGGLCDTLPSDNTVSENIECNIVTPESEYTSTTQSDYLMRLTQICVNNDELFEPTTMCQTPFP